jgi:hypothetical protein
MRLKNGPLAPVCREAAGGREGPSFLRGGGYLEHTFSDFLISQLELMIQNKYQPAWKLNFKELEIDVDAGSF